MATERKLVPVGRLALREEGTNWNAYYALPNTMENAIPLGSIRLEAVKNNSALRQAFMDLMREMVADILKQLAGQRPMWGGIEPAPESERAGNA